MVEALKKILYVEDDADIAEVALVALSELGRFDVKHCMSGQEALKALPDFAPQLVLMDVMMPGMDGVETFKQLKSREEGKHVPVVFMTAKVQPPEQSAYIDMGAIGVVVKPFDPVALSDIIHALWQKAS